MEKSLKRENKTREYYISEHLYQGTGKHTGIVTTHPYIRSI